jgi:hypothetical protein
MIVNHNVIAMLLPKCTGMPYSGKIKMLVTRDRPNPTAVFVSASTAEAFLDWVIA